MNIDRNKKVILYLVNEMGYSIDSSLKLMKIMFLIEHYNSNKRKLVERGLLENSFFINEQGVFSDDVLRCFNSLVSEGKIKDGFPLEANVRVKFNDGEKERIDDIIYEFKNVPNYDLDNAILTMLGIDSFDKREFYGVEVCELIKDNILEK